MNSMVSSLSSHVYVSIVIIIIAQTGTTEVSIITIDNTQSRCCGEDSTTIA